VEKMIAFCGITCAECPAYIATQKNDDNERKKVAEMWSKELSSGINLEDINCDGCLQDEGRLFSYCRECPIKKCAQEKGLKNCAYCDEYPCERLNKILDFVPDAKLTLEEIRKNI